MTVIKNSWSHNVSYSAFINEKNETIISIHTLSAIKLIERLTGKLKAEVKKALNLKEGVTPRSVSKTLGHGAESDELYKVVLNEGLSLIKVALGLKPTDGFTRVNFLVGSTKEYPTNLRIFVRLAGTTVEWIDE